jgi:hypothetical protein
MGLDMYAWAVKSEDVVDDVSFNKDAEKEEIQYWRKHHDLHGWMEELYNERSGELAGTKDFNCIPVRLYPGDLDRLERDVKQGLLPETTGFFFGNNPPDAESVADDLLFISKARQCIKNGFAVYYDSWW